MEKVREILENYDLRELEINRDGDKILVYEYVTHTQDEESGEFLAEFGFTEFEKAFEEVTGRELISTDYDIL